MGVGKLVGKTIEGVLEYTIAFILVYGFIISVTNILRQALGSSVYQYSAYVFIAIIMLGVYYGVRQFKRVSSDPYWMNGTLFGMIAAAINIPTILYTGHTAFEVLQNTELQESLRRWILSVFIVPLLGTIIVESGLEIQKYKEGQEII